MRGQQLPVFFYRRFDGAKETLLLKPWVIWDIEREREKRERENEVGRGLWLPPPSRVPEPREDGVVK